MSNSDLPRNSADAPRLALTPGEPAGIGPDLALKLAAEPLALTLVCVADPAVLAARARQLGCAVDLDTLSDLAAARAHRPGRLQVLPVAAPAPVTPGRLDAANAGYVLACLDRAVAACAAGALDGLVTGPVNKAIINAAGRPFSGHTEYLAERLGAPLPVMMLVGGGLRVVLVTTHLALHDVPAAITQTRIEAVVDIAARELTARFGLARPRLALCGLNPHAGEQGHLGREEIERVEPAAAALRARGLDLTGPLPADTVFTPTQRARFDAIVALYHDQGLGPLKALSFGDAVNVTLGLPIVRTSVDHGTALELAGSGAADPGSLRAALALAARLARGGRNV